MNHQGPHEQGRTALHECGLAHPASPEEVTGDLNSLSLNVAVLARYEQRLSLARPGINGSLLPASLIPPALPNPYDELLNSLSRINTFNPPVQTCSTGWTFRGLYAGPSAVAFLFYRLSHIYPDLLFKSQSLLDWAQAYLELGSRYLDPRRPTVDASHCGVINETLCQLALKCLLSNDSSLALKLCSYASLINSNNDADNGSNEWLYGRAGYLYLLRLVLNFLQNPSENVTKNLNDTMTTTINRILSSPFPWKWLNQPYLGAVHGSIGIVLQILFSSPSHTRQETTQRVRPILLTILNEQLASGNFPSSHSKKGVDDKLVQFCHGSPGVILSLFSIRGFFDGDEEMLKKIDNAIAKAQPDLLERGLLTKTPCLCHGIATNALAISDEGKMMEYLSYMSTASMEGDIGEKLGWLSDAGHTDGFAGLYTGEAGRAWVWAVAYQMTLSDYDENTSGRRIIGYNDI